MYLLFTLKQLYLSFWSVWNSVKLNHSDLFPLFEVFALHESTDVKPHATLFGPKINLFIFRLNFKQINLYSHNLNIQWISGDVDGRPSAQAIREDEKNRGERKSETELIWIKETAS